jgi:capsular exopolysaccharide synthesis family protein
LNGRVVMHAVRRHPLALAAAVVLAAAAGAAVWCFFPLPKVTVAVVFHVAAQPPALLAPMPANHVDFASYRQGLVTLVKRRQTLTSILAQPGVSNLEIVQRAQPDPLTWLDQKMGVDSKSASEYMRVVIEGDQADELLTLLDVAAKSYLATVDARDNGQRRKHLATLKETYEGFRVEREHYHKEIDEIARALGTKDGATLAALETLLREDLRVAARDLGNFREQRETAEDELAALDAATAPRPGERPAGIPDAAIDKELEPDPRMRDLQDELAKANKALASTEAAYERGIDPPPRPLADAREKVKAAEARRDKHRADRRPEIEARIREQNRQAEQVRRDAIKTRMDQLQRRIAGTEEKINEVQGRINKFNERRFELEALTRQIERIEKPSLALGDEIERIKVELGAPSRVTLVEEPYVVPGIEGNRRKKYSLIAALVVFFAGFAGVVGWEYRGRRITHPDELTTELGVRLLGTVPPLAPPSPGVKAVAAHALVEAIDTARTLLLHGPASGAGLRTILVTSAVAGEGKTSLSGHLAISLTRAGFRTLLIDGDLQSPSADRVFNIPTAPGLCELLRGEVDIAGAIRPSPVPGLSLLPAGHWDLAVRQSLAGDRWRQAQCELESQFDFLVIDTAPLLLVSDTLLLAREADAVILSVLLGVSQADHVAAAANRLQDIGARLTGAIVNAVKEQVYTGRYGSASATPLRPPGPTESGPAPAGAAGDVR